MEEDYHDLQTAKSNPADTASGTVLAAAAAGTAPVGKDPCLEGR